MTAAIAAAADALEAGEGVDFTLGRLQVGLHKPKRRTLYINPDGHVGRARGKRRKFVSFHGSRWIRELPRGGTDVETVVIDRGNRIRGRAH